MKELLVSLDITTTSHVYVEAETEEEAKKMALKKFDNDPWYYISHPDSYLDCAVIEVVEP